MLQGPSEKRNTFSFAIKLSPRASVWREINDKGAADQSLGASTSVDAWGLQGKNNSVLQEGSNTSPAATRTKRPTLDKTHPKLHVCLKRNLPTHSNLPQFYTVDYFCCINKGYSRMLPRGFMRLIILKQKSIIISSPVRPIKVSWHVFEIWLINIQNVTKGQLHANGFVGFVKLFVELAKVRLQSLFKIKNHSFKQDRQSILLPGNSLSKYCRRGKKTMAAGCLADKSLPCGFIYFIYMHITMHVAGRWKELNTVKQGNMRAGGRPLKHRFTSHFMSSSHWNCTSCTLRLSYVSASYCAYTCNQRCPTLPSRAGSCHIRGIFPAASTLGFSWRLLVGKNCLVFIFTSRWQTTVVSGEPDKQLQRLTHDTLPRGKPLGHANNNSTSLGISRGTRLGACTAHSVVPDLIYGNKTPKCKS